MLVLGDCRAQFSDLESAHPTCFKDIDDTTFRFHTTTRSETVTMAKPTLVESPQHFSNILSSSRVVVTDFYADWCGPCRAIAPIYESLSAQLSRANQITFTKVNVDEQKQIAQMYNITSMPTFMIFKSGREQKKIQGANVKELDAAIRSLAQEAAASGDSASGSGSSAWTGATIPKGYEDVTDQIDQQGLDFLNLDGEAGTAKSVFVTGKPTGLNTKTKATDTKDWIESDTDEQLMLYIPFQSTMKLHSLHITSLPPSGDEAPMRPKTLKLYTNRTTVLGFDEADDMQSTQTIELKETDYDKQTGTAKVELRFVKFQNISSLVIFVVDGLGDETSEKTRIDRVRLLGETGEKKTMGKLEKIGNEQGE